MTARRRLWIAAAAVAALGAGAQSAHATAPGHNGRIAFRRFLDPDRTHGAIFTINPDGSAERQASNPPADASDDFPDVAADSSVIAFQRCRDFCQVVVARLDGSGAHPVGPGCGAGQAPPACIHSYYVALSPDVKRIAFIGAWGDIEGDAIAHQDIFTMRVDGSHVRRVTASPLRGTVYGEPQWSPDGRRLVFVRYEEDGNQALVTADADGRHQRRVTPWSLHAGDGPDWSPDGSRILFRSPENDDFLNSNLFTIRADGHGLRQITHVAPDTKLYSASFSPDGTQITFGMLGIGGLADIYRMRADGSAIAPVTRTPFHDSAPDWGGLR